MDALGLSHICVDLFVKLYAEAADLIQYCNTALETAQLQIEEIDAKLQASPQATEDDNDE